MDAPEQQKVFALSLLTCRWEMQIIREISLCSFIYNQQFFQSVQQKRLHKYACAHEHARANTKAEERYYSRKTSRAYVFYTRTHSTHHVIKKSAELISPFTPNNKLPHKQELELLFQLNFFITSVFIS